MELCKLDNEANRGERQQNDASVEEIRQKVLRAYSLEYIMPFLREHLGENRDNGNNPPFEFLDNERRVRLTDAGHNRCDDYVV